MRGVYLLSCMLVLFAACGERGASSTAEGWTELPNRHARCFQVFAKGAARRVVVFGPGGRTDTLGVYEQGPDPDAKAQERLPELERIAVLSTTHLPFLSALKRTGRLVAATNLGQVRDEETLSLIERGRVKEVGSATGIDKEGLLLSGAQVVFDHPFGRSTEQTVLQGMAYIPVTEYIEEDPLGRAEWIRFFGVLLDAEDAADSLFLAIEARYRHAQAAVDTTRRPTVIFGSTWQGQWFVPPGNSYMARMIEDAGGAYLFADRQGTGNITLDMETMVAQASGADVWGMIAQVQAEPSVRDFTGGDARLEAFNAVREGHLFIGNTATSDLFGQALLEPDVLLTELHELISIHTVFDHPGGYRAKYFTRPGPPLVAPRIEGS